jgi:hypothetical protein
MNADVVETMPGWLDPGALADARANVPMVYVEAVPVRVDHLGRVERIGMLLQAQPDGSISRVVVSGRVMLNETVREALWRHLSKDLGPDAAPRLPTDAAPFTVVEYFPDPARSGYHDARQHAVALGFVVPCDGECVPPPSALDLTWMTPEEALSDGVIDEMTDGHARLVRRALAHCGITT